MADPEVPQTPASALGAPAIGRRCHLPVIRQRDDGFALDGGALGEVFLPQREAGPDVSPGGVLDVFLLFEPELGVWATPRHPAAMPGEFAFLKVVSVSATGAFLDWGLNKDLRVPLRDQGRKMAVGRSYLVYIFVNRATTRIVGSSRIEKFLDKTPHGLQEGQPVDMWVWDSIEIAYKVIVNLTHSGMLYRNEVFSDIRIGDRLSGFVKKLREDGKLDLCLQKPGYEKVDELSGKILECLRVNKGFLMLTDDSPPDMIHRFFGVSKKTFKKAVGGLLKQRLISLEKTGIRLLK